MVSIFCAEFTIIVVVLVHIKVRILTVYGMDIFGDFGVGKVPKFGNFRTNLVEFRVKEDHFLVVTQCTN